MNAFPKPADGDCHLPKQADGRFVSFGRLVLVGAVWEMRYKG